MFTEFLRCKCGKVYLRQRYIMCFMTFLGITVAYGIRNCINITITAMVKPVINTATDIAHTPLKLCPNKNPPEPEIRGGEYDWSENRQGILLIGFFYGYALGHLPAGILADRFGGKHVFATGVAISAAGSILTPWSIHSTSGNIWPPSIIRFIMGLAQAPMFPAATTLTGAWAPKNERSTIGSIIFTGSQIGSILGNYLTSLLMEKTDTWTYPFYFWGIISLVWYLLDIIMVYSEPAKCPFITEDEAPFLAKEIGPSHPMKVPWSKLLTSAPVWAIIAGTVGFNLEFFFISVQFPKYLNNVLQYTLHEVGIYSSTPYILLWICSNLSALLCDYLIRKEIFSMLTARKFFCIIGGVFPSIFLILVVYMGCNRTAALVFSYLCITSMGPRDPSIGINSIDITKNFAGVVMALSNGLGVVAFLPMPTLAGVFTSKHAAQEWIPLFWGMCTVTIITSLIFACFAKAERQEWDLTEDDQSLKK